MCICMAKSNYDEATRYTYVYVLYTLFYEFLFCIQSISPGVAFKIQKTLE